MRRGIDWLELTGAEVVGILYLTYGCCRRGFGSARFAPGQRSGRRVGLILTLNRICCGKALKKRRVGMSHRFSREMTTSRWAVPTLHGLPRQKLHRSLGAVAQLGERLVCIQEVAGSIPVGSTIRNPLTALVSGLFCLTG
jgi:hypothetical protein